MKVKLLYLSYLAAPHQIKLCNALQKYFDVHFYFYESLGERADWWKIELGKKCHILDNVLFKKRKKYLTFSHLKKLKEMNPDIVMLGGFSVPANYIAYLWAKWHKKKTIIFTERSRDKKGNLRKRNIGWTFFRFLYRNVDMIMVSAEDILHQFRDEFKFGDKVVVSQYASDIDLYFEHPKRIVKEDYVYLFANRLTDLYNPLLAINIFKGICDIYSGSILHMNALGELRIECEKLIKELDIQDKVIFLDNIQSWNDLHVEYKKCDILLFPAKFSNGNFTIIEAMASGMGIVISDKIMGYGQLISDGTNGYKRAPELNLFLEAVMQYVDNPEYFDLHCDRNRTIVKPLGVSATAELYHNLIKTRLL